MSRRPQRSTVDFTSAATAASSATSTAIENGWPPSFSRSRTAASDFVWLRAATTTRAPARASPRAMPKPIPPLPPVTIATLPFNSNMFWLLIVYLGWLFLHHHHFQLIRRQHQRGIVRFVETMQR